MGKVPTELSWKSVAEYLSWRPDQVSSCNLPHFTTLLEGIYDSRQCRCVELQRNSVPTAQSLWSRQKPLVVQEHASHGRWKLQYRSSLRHLPSCTTQPS